MADSRTLLDSFDFMTFLHSRKFSLLLIGAIFLSLGVGCAFSPAPDMPEDWISQQTFPTRTAMEGKPPPRLQVLVVYGRPLASHTALRLVLTEDEVVFWDPAGDYGRFDEAMHVEFGPFPLPVSRPGDILVDQTPDLRTYAQFRWAIEDSSLVAFEWDLSLHTARQLRDVLLYGTDASHPAGSFSTWTFPAFCANATGDFLRRFAGPTVQLNDWYVWPHSLAKALYAQPPSRVRVLVPHERERIYVPPGPASVRN